MEDLTWKGDSYKMCSGDGMFKTGTAAYHQLVSLTHLLSQSWPHFVQGHVQGSK